MADPTTLADLATADAKIAAFEVSLASMGKYISQLEAGLAAARSSRFEVIAALGDPARDKLLQHPDCAPIIGAAVEAAIAAGSAT